MLKISRILIGNAIGCSKMKAYTPLIHISYQKSKYIFVLSCLFNHKQQIISYFSCLQESILFCRHYSYSQNDLYEFLEFFFYSGNCIFIEKYFFVFRKKNEDEVTSINSLKGRVKIEAYDKTKQIVSLTVNPSVDDDVGNYSCIALNDANTEVARGDIIVGGEYVSSKQIFLRIMY